MGDFQQSLSTESRSTCRRGGWCHMFCVLRSAETAEPIANGERIRMMNGGIAAGAGSHCALLRKTPNNTANSKGWSVTTQNQVAKTVNSKQRGSRLAARGFPHTCVSASFLPKYFGIWNHNHNNEQCWVVWRGGRVAGCRCTQPPHRWEGQLGR